MQALGGDVAASIATAYAVAAAMALADAWGSLRLRALCSNLPALSATLLLMWEGALPLVPPSPPSSPNHHLPAPHTPTLPENAGKAPPCPPNMIW